MDDEVVKCITQGEVIKYLGVDFTDEIVFDQLKVLKIQWREFFCILLLFHMSL